MAWMETLESARAAVKTACASDPGAICSLVFQRLSRCFSSEEALNLATALLESGESGLAKVVVARALIEDSENEALALMALKFEVECRAMAA